MAYRSVVVALSAVFIVTPAMATADPDMSSAPEAGQGARYCLKVDAFTGSRIETIKCWTRDQWAEQGVDVDKAWAKDGVAVKE